MKRLRLQRPSPSLVISMVALFVAMGGTGYAAVHLGKNTVGPKQIKTGAVGSSEVKNKSLKTADLSSGAINALSGKPGTTGPQGATGATGATGAPGPSDSWAKDFSGGSPSFSLPPGSYVFGGGVSATAAAGATQLHCFWSASVPSEDSTTQSFLPGQLDDSSGANKAAAVATPASVTVTGPSNFTATLSCSAPGATIVGLATATKVGTLH